VAEVSHELALEPEQSAKYVMWIFDSFSSLVTKALGSMQKEKDGYGSVINMLFRLNSSLIPVPVCSAATTAGALSESKRLSYNITLH